MKRSAYGGMHTTKLKTIKIQDAINHKAHPYHMLLRKGGGDAQEKSEPHKARIIKGLYP